MLVFLYGKYESVFLFHQARHCSWKLVYIVLHKKVKNICYLLKISDKCTKQNRYWKNIFTIKKKFSLLNNWALLTDYLAFCWYFDNAPSQMKILECQFHCEDLLARQNLHHWFDASSNGGTIHASKLSWSMNCTTVTWSIKSMTEILPISMTFVIHPGRITVSESFYIVGY